MVSKAAERSRRHKCRQNRWTIAKFHVKIPLLAKRQNSCSRTFYFLVRLPCDALHIGACCRNSDQQPKRLNALNYVVFFRMGSSLFLILIMRCERVRSANKNTLISGVRRFWRFHHTTVVSCPVHLWQVQLLPQQCCLICRQATEPNIGFLFQSSDK